MSDNYDEKYTHPDLRRALKKEIMQSDKGGEPGQWSARKSQLLVQRYEQEGGGYQKDEKDDAARSLEQWGEQNEQTQDGDRAHWGEQTKQELYDQAKSEEISGRSQMNKDELIEALQDADDDAAKGSSSDDLASNTKAELYEQARELDISGRSKLDKSGLIDHIEDAKS